MTQTTSEGAGSSTSLRRLLRLSPDALGIASLASGQWLIINESFSRILGWTEDDLRGANAPELLHPDDRQEWGRAVAASGADQHRLRVRNRDGHYLSLSWSFDRDNEEGLLYCVGRMEGTPAASESDAALRESREWLLVALEAGRMGTWRYDLRTGKQQWSEQQFRLYGLEPDSIEPSREAFLSMVHPDDVGLVEFGPDDLLADDGLLDAEFRVVHPDGSVHWLVAHTTVRRIGGKAIEMIGVNWDVTERRQHEESLKESAAQLKIALRAGRMGMWTFDIPSGRQHWTDEQFEVFGLTPSDEPPTRQDFLALVHPDDLHLVDFGADDQRPEGTPLETAFRIIRPDGEVRWLAAHALARFGPDGRPSQLIGINQDVTEQRRASDALRVSEDQLRQFGEASSDVIWIRDAGDLQLQYLNPAFDKVFGFTRQDALRGDNYAAFLSLVIDSDRDALLAHMRQVLAGERSSLTYRIRRPTDGSIRWLASAAFPMHDAEGRVRRIGGIDHDTTGLKEAERHLASLLAELQHRARNTLSVIRSIARRTAETSNTVEDYSMHLDARIQAFSRVQAATTRNPGSGVDLELLIRDELRSAAARGRQVEIVGPEVVLHGKVAEAFGLAVHELTTNAIKHGALAAARGRISIRWQREASALLFEWKESGVTMPPPEPTRRGFGTELLERTLTYELDATTSMERGPSGVSWQIRLPLTAMSAD